MMELGLGLDHLTHKGPGTPGRRVHSAETPHPGPLEMSLPMLDSGCPTATLSLARTPGAWYLHCESCMVDAVSALPSL